MVLLASVGSHVAMAARLPIFLTPETVGSGSSVALKRSESSNYFRPWHVDGVRRPAAKDRRWQIVGARRPAKDRNGGVVEALEDITSPEDEEPDNMFMGKKLEGLEPDFWEGDQWNTFGFIIQYLWAFGILVALVGCGVAVASYNLGATDIRDTEVFKEALENQVESDSSFESDNSLVFPMTTDAPPLE